MAKEIRVKQHPMACLMPVRRAIPRKCQDAYQAKDDDYCSLSCKTIAAIHSISVTVGSANRCNPVHTGDRSCQDGRACRSFQPTVGPSGFEIEENSKSNGGSDDCNEGRAHDIAPIVRNVVIGYPLLAKVVHATDSSASHDANNNDSTDVDFSGKAQEVESDTHNTDWKKERSSGATGAVSNLEFAFSVNHGDGTVANEMHGPDSDSSHGDGSANE